MVPFLASAHWGIGATVFVNGALCHNARAYGSDVAYARLRCWDVACNVALVLYVNCTTALQTATHVLTCISTVAWVANNVFFGQSAVLHATLVQWPLCAACLCY